MCRTFLKQIRKTAGLGFFPRHWKTDKAGYIAAFNEFHGGDSTSIYRFGPCIQFIRQLNCNPDTSSLFQDLFKRKLFQIAMAQWRRLASLGWSHSTDSENTMLKSNVTLVMFLHWIYWLHSNRTTPLPLALTLLLWMLIDQTIKMQ